MSDICHIGVEEKSQEKMWYFLENGYLHIDAGKIHVTSPDLSSEL